MSNTHDDDLDPTEGILADLASLRASRDAADDSSDSDPDRLSALDEIAAAAARLREHEDDDAVPDDAEGGDGDRDAPAARTAQTTTASGQESRARSARSERSAGASSGLVFESYASDRDSDDEDSHSSSAARSEGVSRSGAPSGAGARDDSDGASPSPSVDPRNPFSHSSDAATGAFAPAAVPAGGGLLFQPPQEDFAQPADPDWYTDDDSDDEYDSEDRYDDQESTDDDADSSSDSDSTGSDDDGGDGRGRSRRRRGGRGRRSRGRDRSSDDGSDDESDGGHSAADRSGDDGSTSDADGGRRGSRRGRRRTSSGSDDAHGDSGADSGAGGDGGSGERVAHGESDDDASRSGRSDGGQAVGDRSGRRSSGDSGSESGDSSDQRHGGSSDDSGDAQNDSDDDSSSSRRRRRRRGRSSRRDGGGGDTGSTGDDQVTSIKGSTRLEAKRQRRREGREAGRRRPLLTEAEFLARRESVDRTMLVREQTDRTQLVVLEDGVTVEHYLSEHKAQASLIGNVYMGRVQNVLPSMEAAFIDIGKGRNAVLYAGEVNWDALGMNGKPQRIEQALSSGDSVLVQVTKDPVGHKGARLTSQISLPGRFLVYIPGNSMTGISRKLPDNERARLKKLLKEILPEQAGVIVRTASEGASDEELRRDVDRLTKRWESIQKKSKAPKPSAPKLLYSEPDMIVRIIRDVFNEDFEALVVDGEGAWDTIHEYVEAVAPDLLDRVSRYGAEGTPTAESGAAGTDIFDHFRVNEQIEKALSRKVNLPSGGSLVIDRTEAMTVVDVNTGKFTGSGGNLEETVTKNNLEAADEVIRQLRLRDIGGIIVVDFIDMVLESNRDLVTRRLVECLARDRTRHQVAEVTSLGLVQMTRKRIGTGLAESLSAAGEDLAGRGLMLPGSDEKDAGGSQRGGQRGRSQGKGGDGGSSRSSDSRRGSDGGRGSGGSSRGSKEQPAAQDDERGVDEQTSQSRSAVAAIAKATLKKSDEETGQEAAAAATDASPSTSDDSKSEGRRSRRRGGRSRSSAKNTDSQRTDGSPAEEGAADHQDSPAAADTQPKAPSAPESTGPMPLMIGADSTTTVQTKVAKTADRPTAGPVTEDSPSTTEDSPSTETLSTEPAGAGASESAAATTTESQAPAAPILMLGMDD
ncbi:Rne/Rng family ribonuclease [Brevibacterium jeotgali]|uniref:Ribonuclease E n=1 Tax=Brevibacterium jeotgali TaxID=1262550 RepID=A0A2H1L7D3_9MICO|nr:Rne/Rng family ribonuclease [Brevibacterium jeotgali]TWC03117.1 ribonuclease E [Brevibacterium jeotgali]SMY12824.1 ribonuclease E [Brevibacterium jeotgali]